MKIRNITSKNRRSKVTDFAAVMNTNAAKIICKNLNSLQLISSDWSRQSTTWSQRKISAMHCPFLHWNSSCRHVPVFVKVSKDAKIRNRYIQVPHLTQDTNGKVTNSQLDITNESQEVSAFRAGDHKTHINRHAQRHSIHKTEQKHKRSTKEVPPWNGQ